MDLIDNKRCTLRNEFCFVRSILLEMETAFMADVDSCSTQTTGISDEVCASYNNEDFSMLKEFLRPASDDPIDELGLYSKANAALASISQVQTPREFFKQLKNELAYGFEQRFSRITGILDDIEQLGCADAP
eukprot:CAMPEP_0169088504 /NCGR_PEP_ID=MMETSP1015-20121227/14788_1 /TAXON_ID=342587 /ORGANISM="Karlodinium micrum, Strain CCMP2283" /LENGTH=131 /DNA_ID=CAMNT_0009148781 /DNA_START=468 /DNA_END=863 /DNA_ORIENTATION=-